MTIAAFTLAGGAWIFLAFVIVFLAAVIYGLYTRGGSGINQRPHGSVYSNAPGAKIPSTLSHDESAATRYTAATTPTWVARSRTAASGSARATQRSSTRWLRGRG